MIYTISQLKAKGHHVLIIRDAEETVTKDGLAIPEWSIKKPNTGKILSVGSLVEDKGIKKGDIALFSDKSGFDIEFFDAIVTVLRDDHIISTI